MSPTGSGALVAVELTSTDTWMLVVILVLLAVLAFLAVAETAITRVSLPKAEAVAEERPGRSSAALLALVKQPERFINPVLVTVTVLQTGQAFLTSLLAARITDSWVGPVVAFALNVVIFFVASEAMPKTWAILHFERAALMTARPVLWLVSFPPLRLVTRGLIGLTNVLLPGKGLKQGPFVSERELLGIVQTAAQEQVIEHEERELIESIIEFGDTMAREVMVPRPDIVSVEADDTVGQALDTAIDHGYSRLPVFEEDDGDVVGVAYTKDLIRAEREGGGVLPVRKLVRPVRFVPENKLVSHLMREMQSEKMHMVMVLDEYGDLSGLVTLEDCLEELVGEIHDEYDRESASVMRLGEREFLVDGGLGVDDLNELLSTHVPDEEWDTVAGFVFGTLGHVPEIGESTVYGGWRFTAEKLDGRRIRQVRVTYTGGAAEVDGHRPVGG